MELINTLEQASEFDALAKLRPGEPYFLLIGRDLLAPALVKKWADDNRQRAWADFDAGRITEAQLEDEQRKSTQAETISWGMKEYKKGYVAKPVETETRPTYTGHQLPEETQRSDDIQRARVRASSAAHACIADLHVQAQEFERLGMVDEAGALNAKVASLRHFADVIKPPRPLPGQPR